MKRINYAVNFIRLRGGSEQILPECFTKITGNANIDSQQITDIASVKTRFPFYY